MNKLAVLALIAPVLAAPATAQSWDQHLVTGTTDTRLPSGLVTSPTVIAFGQPRFDRYNTFGIDDVVRIFEKQGSDFVEVADLRSSLSPASSASYGTTMAMEGNVIAVGDPSAQAVHIYRRGPAAWTLESVIQAVSTPNLFAGSFGSVVDLDQGRLVVGAFGATTGNASGSGNLEDGAVFVYENITGSWQEVQRLFSPGAGVFNHYGRDLELDGNALIVGEPGFGTQGAAHIYQHNGTDFVLTNTLTPSPGSTTATMGVTVALESGLAAAADVGVFINTWGDGRVHLFENSMGGWGEVATLQDPGDGHHIANRFGTDIELDGGALFVTSLASASVQRFEPGPNGWAPVKRYSTSAGFSWPHSLELRVQAEGNRVVLTDHEGVTVLERNGPATLEFNCDGVPLGNGTYEFPLQLEPQGELSFGQGELPFTVYTATSLGSGVLLYGFSATEIPFGAGGGNLCVAGPITRAAISSGTQPNGSYPQVVLDLTSGPVTTGPGSFGPGTTVFIQYWSRVTGGGSHLSNSLEMVFAP